MPGPGDGAAQLMRAAGLLEPIADPALDRLARVAARVLHAAAAAIILVDGDRGFLRSHCGLPAELAERRELPLTATLCARPARSGTVTLIEELCGSEALDEAPLARELGLRSYAGVPLRHADGTVIAVLSVLDSRPRAWTPDEVQLLEDLAASVHTEIEWRIDAAARVRAAETLRQNEARYRLMVEGSEQVFFYVHDRDGRFEYLSPSVRAVLGYEPAELLGKSYRVLLTGHASDAAVEQRTEETLLGEAAPSTYEALTRHRDGRTVIVEIVESAVVRGGEVVGVQGFARDITERRRAETELHVQTAHLEQLIESAPEGIVLLDNQARVLRINREFTRMFGYAPAEALGRRVDDLIVPPDQRTEGDLLTERVAQGETLGARAVRRRKDGSLVHVSILATPIVIDGRRAAIYGIYRDISDQVRAEEAVRRSERHFRALIEYATDVIVVVDEAGTIRYASPSHERVLGYPPDEVVGRSVFEFVHPDDLAFAREVFRYGLAEPQGIRRLEVRVPHRDGRWREFKVIARNLFHDPAVGGMVLTSRDITEERLREAQLRRAERLTSLGTLLGGVAHELNNPLTSIKSFAQLMLMDERVPEDREALEVIHREADRAAKIVADLRLVARQTQAAESASRQRLDLNDVVRHVLHAGRAALQQHGIEVHEELAAEPLPVLAEWGGMEQLVHNLVRNAEQAMRDREGVRRLTLRTGRQNGGVVLEVVDTGGGIAPEHLEHIFDPFWTTRAPGEGTGLGLSLVHSIVAEHGGQVRVQSELGRGSTFRVELPVAHRTRAEVPATEPPPAAAVPLRILLVEDEAPIRLSLAWFLERRGHRVDAVPRVADALACLRGGAEYDLIISDLRMPGLGGDALFKWLVAQGAGLEQRLIVITGDATRGEAERLLAGAGVPVLLKPFALEELAAFAERHAAPAAEVAVERG